MFSVKVFRWNVIGVCASLLLLGACETNQCPKFKENNMQTITLTLSDLMSNEIAETTADFTWNELDNGDWHFTVEFIAKEGTSAVTDSKPFKNLPITIYYRLPIDQVKAKKGYKPGVKPIKHQKIKIEYLKNEPGLTYNRLGNIKCKDNSGLTIELN